MDLLSTIEAEISTRRLLQRGDRVVVAVSGGVDSMVLLHLLALLAPALELDLAVAHFNHQLRGTESGLDEDFVRRESESRRIPFYSSTGDVRQYAEEQSLSIEMAARELRHRFFAALARSLSAPRITLAHHADDQVENLWLRLLRGSASEALAGMKWISPSPADPAVQLVRPLLGLRRGAIQNFAREQRILFRVDASNENNDYLRNRVRNTLLPLLEREYQPAIFESSTRLMEVLGAEKEWLNAQAFDWLVTPARPFSELHPALQRAILHLQIINAGVPPAFDLIEHLRLRPNVPISIRPGEQLLRGAEGTLRIEQVPETAFRPESLAVDLTQPAGQVNWNGVRIEFSLQNEGRIEHMPGREIFDADRVGPRICLRHWQPGDTFQPIGMPQPVKLQDLFTNLKIPLEKRRHLVLAETAAGTLFWVESLRIGDTAKISASTRRFLHWRWRREPAA